MEEIRLPGLVCPLPVLRAKKAIAKIAFGEKLAVWSTDPHSLPDLAEFCRQTGHHLLEQSESEDEDGHWFVSVIERREPQN